MNRAAGNWGVYPRNGAERVCMPAEDADRFVRGDEDGYTRVVREATPADLRKYGPYAICDTEVEAV